MSARVVYVRLASQVCKCMSPGKISPSLVASIHLSTGLLIEERLPSGSLNINKTDFQG